MGKWMRPEDRQASVRAALRINEPTTVAELCSRTHLLRVAVYRALDVLKSEGKVTVKVVGRSWVVMKKEAMKDGL